MLEGETEGQWRRGAALPLVEAEVVEGATDPFPGTEDVPGGVTAS
jgi:hypothetical protein